MGWLALAMALVTAPAATSLQQLVEHMRPVVVLDAGHGGADPGAIGVTGLREKDVTLPIALQAARLLRQHDVEVVLTRTADTTVSLRQRSLLANRRGAALLISIHANAAVRAGAAGLETYYLNVTADRYAIRLAARENASSEQKIDALQVILADLSTKAATGASYRLAQRVQAQLLQQVTLVQPTRRDLGVKAALFYVLLGARMPAVLVETGFVTNPQEARLLRQPSYQAQLARAVAIATLEHLDAQWLPSPP